MKRHTKFVVCCVSLFILLSILINDNNYNVPKTFSKLLIAHDPVPWPPFPPPPPKPKKKKDKDKAKTAQPTLIITIVGEYI
jgi:hypothetical protein